MTNNINLAKIVQQGRSIGHQLIERVTENAKDGDDMHEKVSTVEVAAVSILGTLAFNSVKQGHNLHEYIESVAGMIRNEYEYSERLSKKGQMYLKKPLKPDNPIDEVH